MASVPVPEASKVAAPRLVAPSRKFTVPVGTVVPEAGVTMAVKVTDCPTTDGFTEEVSTVVVPVRAVAGWVTVAFWFATLMIATCVAPDVFGAAVAVIVALPVPLAFVTVSQGALLDAVQAQFAEVVTCRGALPPV